MSANGGETRRITTENDLIDGLAWTADNREIVFGSGGGYAARLRRVAATGGTPQPVAGASPGADYPAISRSSHRLAYVSIAIQISTWRLELLQPGNRPDSLVKLIASTKTDMNAQYSPDGRKIVFGSFRSGTAEIWVANDDGSASAPLTAFGGPNTGTPHWSPDGKRIAFDALIEGNADIWIMNADGGSLRRVTTNPALDYVPSWSRDGRRIYFASNRTGDFQVWKVDPDTGRELQITHHGGFNAMESPDGHVLYFSKSQDENTEVWKIPSNGGTELAAMLSREGQPIKVAGWYYWHAFNDGVYFVQIVPGPSSLDEIRFFNFDTGKSTLIKTLTGYRADPGGLRVLSDRRWMLFAQGDRVDKNIMLVNNFR